MHANWKNERGLRDLSITELVLIQKKRWPVDTKTIIIQSWGLFTWRVHPPMNVWRRLLVCIYIIVYLCVGLHGPRCCRDCRTLHETLSVCHYRKYREKFEISCILCITRFSAWSWFTKRAAFELLQIDRFCAYGDAWRGSAHKGRPSTTLLLCLVVDCFAFHVFVRFITNVSFKIPRVAEIREVLQGALACPMQSPMPCNSAASSSTCTGPPQISANCMRLDLPIFQQLLYFILLSCHFGE